MITKEKMPGSFIKSSQLILKGNVWRSVWRICMWILGLKGLKTIDDPVLLSRGRGKMTQIQIMKRYKEGL